MDNKTISIHRINCEEPTTFLAVGVYDRAFETPVIGILGISSDPNVLLDSLYKRFEQVGNNWLVATETLTLYSHLNFHELGIIQIPAEQPELIMYLSTLKVNKGANSDNKARITLAQMAVEIEGFVDNPPISPRI